MALFDKFYLQYKFKSKTNSIQNIFYYIKRENPILFLVVLYLKKINERKGKNKRLEHLNYYYTILHLLQLNYDTLHETGGWLYR